MPTASYFGQHISTTIHCQQTSELKSTQLIILKNENILLAKICIPKTLNVGRCGS